MRDCHVTLVAILKGGCRKSTTAMLTAIGLAQLGEDVLVIDADAGTQGVTDWATRAFADGLDLPVDVAQWSPVAGLLVPFVQAHQARTKARHVLIDVGGEAPEVIRQAALVADRVIVPMGTEQAEIGRLGPTLALIEVTRPDLPVAILLTRVPVPGAGAARETRDLLTAEGRTVLPIEVARNLAMYADVWGSVPASVGAYGDLAAYLQAYAAPAVAR